MLKNKTFWVGFLVGYFLVVFVPQVNVTNLLKKG